MDDLNQYIGSYIDVEAAQVICEFSNAWRVMWNSRYDRIHPQVNFD